MDSSILAVIHEILLCALPLEGYSTLDICSQKKTEYGRKNNAKFQKLSAFVGAEKGLESCLTPGQIEFQPRNYAVKAPNLRNTIDIATTIFWTTKFYCR